MHVAVAGMEHVDAAQSVLRLELLDAREQRTDRAARHGAVHAVIIGGNAPGGRKRVLAARPVAQPLAFVARDLDARRAMLAQHGRHAHDFLRHFLRRPVRFAQQDRLRVEVVARVRERLDGLGGRLVHHLESGRDDARRDDRGDCLAALHDIVEARHHELRGLRFRDQFQRDLGDDREHPFAADHHREQVEARRVEAERAEFDDLAVDRDRAHAHDVVHGQPVFQAVDAAGIFRDVAADRAGDLRRRIGCVVQPVRRGGFRNREVAHAGLHGGRARVRIDLDDAREACERQHDAVADRQRAARQARARAARHDRHFHAAADLHDPLHLRFGFGQRDREGQPPVRGQAVAFVRRGVFVAEQQAMRRQHGHQRLHDFALALRAGRARQFDGSVHWVSCGGAAARRRVST
ncbi:hypothetical protein BamIOP4010DRAFT_3543 [Burkholderia ambifaria IOP40-10]|uniref:Uncharacterized protein n=1 Tax=Burkholderia ambifaria IOP40-10 TaxID=396596 RepID=B1FHN3_9BURK|nr:hypothetical protein BamIOP4010DRAFT_3543 [Burkholderia ambifaria IOP40-10]